MSRMYKYDLYLFCMYSCTILIVIIPVIIMIITISSILQIILFKFVSLKEMTCSEKSAYCSLHEENLFQREHLWQEGNVDEEEFKATENTTPTTSKRIYEKCAAQRYELNILYVIKVKLRQLKEKESSCVLLLRLKYIYIFKDKI